MIYPYQYFSAGAISILLGVALGSYLSINLWVAALALAFGVGVLFMRPPTWLRLWLVILLGLVIGVSRFSVNIYTPLPSQFLNHDAVVEGVVVSHPEIQDSQQTFYLRTTTIDTQPLRHRVLVQTFIFPQLAYGDTVSTTISLQADSTSGYLRYLRKDGVVAIGRTQTAVEIVQPASSSLVGVLYRLRDAISGKVQSLFPEPAAGLINGLLLGLRTQLSDEFKTALKNSGTTHIIALSGFNITIVASFMLFLFKPLGRSRSLFLAGLGVLVFVLLTGASSSVVRAAIMGWILLLTLWWGRKRHGLNAVLVAGALMVLFNPYTLQYDIGFQLSFVATLGIILMVPLLERPLHLLPKTLREIIATTIAATIFTLPLVTFHFGGFSAVALLANAVVLPLIPLVMLVGAISLAAFAILPVPAINIVGLVLAGLVTQIISWFGSWRLAFVTTPPLSAVWPVLYYLMLAIVYLRHHAKTQPRF